MWVFISSQNNNYLCLSVLVVPYSIRMGIMFNFIETELFTDYQYLQITIKLLPQAISTFQPNLLYYEYYELVHSKYNVGICHK